jgi:hypothetical protein
LISESRTFLHLTPEWAGVIVSVFALFFAWKGYQQLIRSKVDTQAQIKSLAEQALETGKVAKSISELATLTHFTHEAARTHAIPCFKLENYTFHNHTGIVSLRNVGLSPAILVRMDSESGIVPKFKLGEHDFVQINGKINLDWPQSDSDDKVQYWLWFSDSFQARYVQRFTILRGELNSDLPLRCDIENDKVPPYMREHKPPNI